MHPSEASAAMAADTSLGLVVDRRQPGPGRSLPEALDLVCSLDLGEGDRDVHAWLVRARGGGPLPPRVLSDAFGVQVRLMDRFYLPKLRDQGLVRTVFDLVAGIYDDLVTHEVNLRTARMLLGKVLEGSAPNPLVLDFGCGTGIAAQALAGLGREAKLLGVDLSAAMLRQAAARGEATMSLQDWRRCPPPVEGAIASFVLHYGVPDEDLARIGAGLRPGGRFAANLFRLSPAEAGALEQRLSALSLDLVDAVELGGTSASNLMLVFSKR